jgi:hypothetical protein
MGDADQNTNKTEPPEGEQIGGKAGEMAGKIEQTSRGAAGRLTGGESEGPVSQKAGEMADQAKQTASGAIGTAQKAGGTASQAAQAPSRAVSRVASNESEDQE